MEKYLLFYILAFVAEVVGTISGFGSSILFVPIASLFFDFKAVLGITALFHIASNLFKIYLFRHGVEKHIVVKMGLPAIGFVVLGALLTNLFPQTELEFIMGILIFVLAAYLLFNIKRALKRTDSNLIKGGIVSGFLAGLVGTGGAVRGLALTAFDLEKNVFIATSALIDLGVDSGRAIVYALNGYVRKEMLSPLPFLLAISFIGTWTGKLLLRKISQQVFKRLVLWLILLVSLGQIAGHIYKLIS